MSVSSQVPDATTPFYDAGGYINPVWHNFFFTLLRRTGGTEGSSSEDEIKRIAAVERRITDEEKVEYATVPLFGLQADPDFSQVFPHGIQADPTLHDPVTASANGFMLATDKAKLDTISANAAVASVSGTAPIASSGGATPAISISAATISAAGSMSAADKAKLDALAVPLVSPAELLADVVTTNTTADGAVIAFTVSANTATVGMTISMRLCGLISSAASAGTISVWVKIGATKVISQTFTLPAAAQTNTGLFYTSTMTVRTLGASGTAQLSSLMTSNANALNAGPLVASASTALNTTISSSISIGWNWSVANAANIATAKNAAIFLEKQ